MVFRFIIGQTSDTKQEADLQEEISQYGDFIRLKGVEKYLGLNKKTWVLIRMKQIWRPCMLRALKLLEECTCCGLMSIPLFFSRHDWSGQLKDRCLNGYCACRLEYFKTIFLLYDADFYVKADDDIYLQTGAVCPCFRLISFMNDYPFFFVNRTTSWRPIYVMSHTSLLPFDARSSLLPNHLPSRADRLAAVLRKPRKSPRTYLGCLKKGMVIGDPKYKWWVCMHVWHPVLILQQVLWSFF